MRSSMMKFRRSAATAINCCLRPTGFKLVRAWSPGGYIDAKTTVQAAQARGQSVCEYVEAMWNQPGATGRVIEEMKKAGCLAPCKRVLEIGPGTGRYLELVLQTAGPEQYDIYETAEDWATWLSTTYAPLVWRQPADGHTLRNTPSESCALVHAHGVFVYLKIIDAFMYFAEMIRVCEPQGFVVFDFFPAEVFGEDTIRRWFDFPDRYAAVLPGEHVKSFFVNRGFDPVHEFHHVHGPGHSNYFIFRKGHSLL